MNRRTFALVSVVMLLASMVTALGPAYAAGTVTLRSTSTMVNDGTNFTVTKPVGLAANDVMVASLSINAGGAVTAPAGWTLIGHTESLGVVELWTYYRVAGASEPASYTWTTTGGAAGTLGIAAYVGVDTTAPLIGFSSATDGGGATQATAPAVASSTTGVALLLLTIDGSFAGTLTYPASFTQRWSLVDYERGYAADDLTNISGNLPARTITLSSTNFWSIQQVGLRAAGGVPAPAPTITTVSPTSGSTLGGTSVSVNGTNFQAGATVSFGGSPLTVTNITPTAITGTTSAHSAGSVSVVVTNPDAQLATCASCFTYVAPAPTITSVAPSSGTTAGGTSVTVNGANFQTGATVSFGGSAMTVSNVTSSAISGTTTAHAAGAVNVTVTNPDTKSGACTACYTYNPPPPRPAPTSVTPGSGSGGGGTSVTINGTAFVTGATASFGGSALSIASVTATTITGTTSAHSPVTVDVIVTNPDAQSGTCVACFAYLPPPPPSVTSVSPNSGSGAGGTAVTINGTDFQSGVAVSFGGSALTVATVTPTTIGGTTTAHAAATVNVTVMNPDTQSATCLVCFTYLPPPPATVTSVAPTTGTTAGGTSVTVNGTNFQSGATVSFGGTAMAIASITPSAITGTTPGHAAGAVDVSVTNPEQPRVTCAACYTYVTPPAPTVASVTPNNGSTAGGTSVTVNGANFQPGATVSFGGSALTVGTITSTTISGTTTAHAAGAVGATVTNPDAQSASCSACFTYAVPPSVTLRGISTLAGSGGRSNFVVDRPVGVTANDVMIASLSLNGGGTATAPAGWTLIAHTVNASVIHLWSFYHVAGSSEPADYTFKASSAAGVAGIAAYVGIDPASPVIGFSSATSTTNQATAPAVTSTATSVALLLLTIDGSFAGTVTHPTGFTQRWALQNYERGYFADRLAIAGGTLPAATIALSTANYSSIQQIALRVGGGAPAPAPTVSSVNPSSGSTNGGNAITLNGTGFQQGATVLFGGSALTGTTVTPTTITGTTPAHAAGAVNVVVTNPDTQTGSCAACFTYVAPAPAPTVTSTSPNSGTSAGGQTISVNGTNFQTGATVTLGGTPLTVTSVTATVISGTTRVHAPGAVSVVATNPDQQSGTCASCYTYVAAPAPTVTGIAPNTGSTLGNDAVTVSGSNFQAGATVSIGGSLLNVTTVNATQITGTTRSRAAGVVNVVVTNADTQSGTCVGCFSYIGAGNAIQSENALPGTPGWNDFVTIADQLAISGYGSKTSVSHGETIDLFITTRDSTVSIDVFRTGYYGGVGARRVTSLGSFPGRLQAIPAPDPNTGMIAATGWLKTTTVTIPSDWVTGVYVAKLTGSPSGRQSFIFFVVRNDGGHEKYVFQSSVTTAQAYNQYGGVSLYANVTNKSVYSYNAATKVSFDRPFDPQDGQGAGQFFQYEYPWLRWAESQGYDMTYLTNIDTDTNVNPLTNHKAFLSIGHDEYWSKGMRDNVTAAMNAGVNLGFFSANTMYWQIRLEPNSLGNPNRVQVGYKSFSLSSARPGPDPFFCPATPCAPGTDNTRVTTYWRDWPVTQPEQLLLGVMSGSVANEVPYVVQNSSHWVYAGTGLTDGSRINGIVGYEYDAVYASYVDGNSGATITLTPQPGLTILSRSPVGSAFSNSTIYTAASGARVFASGTIEWSSGLDSSGYGCTGGCVSAALQQTTRNILSNFGN
jgi:hypothetical protein